MPGVLQNPPTTDINQAELNMCGDALSATECSDNPCKTEQKKLEPGDIAKIRFSNTTSQDNQDDLSYLEIMWVIVYTKLGNWYIGELDTELPRARSSKSGMQVWFEEKHILEIQYH
ncbi:MAG: hypothetical protein KA902_01515 [Arenimonas sp.]|nr:hypothetical protein [Arenimonas sp.]